MADLYLSGGDTLPDDETRPTTRAPGSRPWDRHVPVPATAADRGTFWQPVPDEQFPSRMARRRALEAAQILDGWRPDPVLTPRLLAHVGDQLLRLFEQDVDVVDAEAAADAPARETAPRRVVPGAGVADPPVEITHADATAEAPRTRGHRRRKGEPSPARRRGWRRGRAAAAHPDAVSPHGAAGVVRQDDPVDDAAWFAGLRAMTREDERAEAETTATRATEADTPEADRTEADTPEADRTEADRTEADRTEADTPQTVLDDAVLDDAVLDDAVLDDALPVEDAEREPVAAAPVERTVDRLVHERPEADAQRIVPASPPRHARPARRWIAAVLAAVVVVAGGVAMALNRGDTHVAGPAGPAEATQQSIVVALSLSKQAATANAQKPAKTKGKKAVATPAQPQPGDVTGLSLLAAGGGSAQQVLVPSRLLLDVPGAGRVPLARSLMTSSQAPGEAIEDALEIKVDATWTLDSTALAALVDRVGGVVVDVDTDITQGTQVGAAVLLGAGAQQKLTGQQAALFAQFSAADEPEAARLARQEQVLRAVLSALPDDPATIRTVLAGLPGAPTGAALDAVVRVVGATRLAAVSNELASTMLPVKEIDAGGTVTSYGLDDTAATQLVDTRLAGAKLPVAAVGHVRVLVQNGVGAPGLGDSARARLIGAGLRYVAGGNLPGFGQGATVVLLRDASSTSRERGMAVARALGLGESSLRISESAPTVADIVVILGADYRAA